MAKKKTVNNNNSLKDILGFDIFQNEKLNFFLGLALFGVALYIVISFVSFLTTGKIDQSMIESAREGEVMNQKGEYTNYCDSLGAYVS